LAVSHSEQDTETLGAALSARLVPGDVVLLRGGLGAGKTAFVRGLAAGLSCQGTVSSPTFALVNEYPGGRLPLFHFDLYRLSDWDALLDIGWDGYLARGGVCAVEWSENAFSEHAPHYVVAMRQTGDTTRHIAVTAPDGLEVSL